MNISRHVSSQQNPSSPRSRVCYASVATSDTVKLHLPFLFFFLFLKKEVSETHQWACFFPSFFFLYNHSLYHCQQYDEPLVSRSVCTALRLSSICIDMQTAVTSRCVRCDAIGLNSHKSSRPATYLGHCSVLHILKRVKLALHMQKGNLYILCHSKMIHISSHKRA